MSDAMSPARGVSADASSLDPSRILFVSANMGAGHNATARAVEQSARRLWPHAETRWVDTLDVMGPGVGPLFRQIYVTNVQTTPWLYEFFYGSLWRHRWFASASKQFVGAWCGRLLAPVIDEYAPDLIVSTYPLGSAGLQWLRRHRGFATPIAAWISDFAPHPFWVYPDLDMHFVMHDACIDSAKAAVPVASVQSAAPPVSDAFGPADRSVARDKLDLDQDAFVALLSCGAFGFGTVEKAVDTLLAADSRIQVLAVCGSNEQLRQRIAQREAQPGRLRALGWVDDMSTYVTASDAVVTNAGGATSLEAMACGRAVIMFEPIAAHGRANAELMAEAGLAVLCRTPNELRDEVRAMLEHPDRLASLEQAALEHAESRTREDDLRAVTTTTITTAATSAGATSAGAPSAGPKPAPASSRIPRLRSVQPEDVFFLYADTPAVNQMLGGVVYLERQVDLDTTLAEVDRSLEGLPNLRRRLVWRNSSWRRPTWLFEDKIDVRVHVKEHVLGAAGEPGTFAELVDDFFSRPLDLRRPPWELHLVQGLDGGRSAILVKLHHVLGDGFAAIDSMAGLLQDVPGAGGGADATTTSPAKGQDAPDAGSDPDKGKLQLVQQRVRRVATGLWGLARGGGAPPSVLNGPMTDGSRRHAMVSLPVSEVRATARALGTGTNALLLTVIAGGLNRLLDERDGGSRQAASVRVMVPRTIRTLETRHALGNITAAVPLDVPLGSFAPRQRLAEVERRMQRSLNGGQPEASRFLMKAMGVLPAPVHARVSRVIYSARWFNAIVSVIPGPRTKQQFAGTELTAVYPVLPMADGVGLAVGLMRWAEDFAIGLTGDAALMHDVDRLADAVRESFAEFRRAAGE